MTDHVNNPPANATDTSDELLGSGLSKYVSTTTLPLAWILRDAAAIVKDNQPLRNGNAQRGVTSPGLYAWGTRQSGYFLSSHVYTGGGSTWAKLQDLITTVQADYGADNSRKRIITVDEPLTWSDGDTEINIPSGFTISPDAYRTITIDYEAATDTPGVAFRLAGSGAYLGSFVFNSPTKGFINDTILVTGTNNHVDGIQINGSPVVKDSLAAQAGAGIRLLGDRNKTTDITIDGIYNGIVISGSDSILDKISIINYANKAIFPLASAKEVARIEIENVFIGVPALIAQDVTVGANTITNSRQPFATQASGGGYISKSRFKNFVIELAGTTHDGSAGGRLVPSTGTGDSFSLQHTRDSLVDTIYSNGSGELGVAIIQACYNITVNNVKVVNAQLGGIDIGLVLDNNSVESRCRNIQLNNYHGEDNGLNLLADQIPGVIAEIYVISADGVTITNSRWSHPSGGQSIGYGYIVKGSSEVSIGASVRGTGYANDHLFEDISTGVGQLTNDFVQAPSTSEPTASDLFPITKGANNGGGRVWIADEAAFYEYQAEHHAINTVAQPMLTGDRLALFNPTTTMGNFSTSDIANIFNGDNNSNAANAWAATASGPAAGENITMGLITPAAFGSINVIGAGGGMGGFWKAQGYDGATWIDLTNDVEWVTNDINFLFQSNQVVYDDYRILGVSGNYINNWTPEINFTAGLGAIVLGQWVNTELGFDKSKIWVVSDTTNRNALTGNYEGRRVVTVNPDVIEIWDGAAFQTYTGTIGYDNDYLIRPSAVDLTPAAAATHLRTKIAGNGDLDISDTVPY